MEKIKVAIIGGTGFEKMLKGVSELRPKTPYGLVPSLLIGKVANRQVVFLPRHGPNHSVPPHMINYRANIRALHEMGVERIIATNAVGAINRRFKPGDMAVPHDFVDFTKNRSATFYDGAPVTHIDVSQPFCPQIRELLIEIARKHDLRVWEKAVLVCTEGPRYETPAEIGMFRRLGCQIVGMTGFPEAVLARELQMCYASICYITNRGAGMQQRLTVLEVSKSAKETLPKIQEVLIETIRVLPAERDNRCSCAKALESARFR